MSDRIDRIAEEVARDSGGLPEGRRNGRTAKEDYSVTATEAAKRLASSGVGERILEMEREASESGDTRAIGAAAKAEMLYDALARHLEMLRRMGR